MTLPRGEALDSLAVWVMIALGVAVWAGVVWSQRPRRKKLPKWWDVPKPRKPWPK